MFAKRILLHSAQRTRNVLFIHVKQKSCIFVKAINCEGLVKNPSFLTLQSCSDSRKNTRYYSENKKETSLPILERVQQMVKNKKVVIFMKGIPDQPMCGFSNAVVQVFRMHGIKDYDAHNVLEDDELRQGIKDFSEWPTIPQIYFNGEFIGGCDILLQMHQSGDLIEELEKLDIKSDLIK